MYEICIYGMMQGRDTTGTVGDREEQGISAHCFSGEEFDGA